MVSSLKLVSLLSLTLGLSLSLAGCTTSEAVANRAAAEQGAVNATTSSMNSALSPAAPAQATVAIGQPAPDFTLTDLDGNKVTLSAFKGKTVVLEWFNPGCPFVKYAHGEGPLKTLPATYTARGVVWLAINSGAPGKQGTGVDTNKEARAGWGMSYPVMLDENGQVGRLYGAKTTPHMFVIDGEGVLRYQGALDNAPLGEKEGDLVPYVVQALDALLAGKPVTTSDTKAYGCSVKYGS